MPMTLAPLPQVAPDHLTAYFRTGEVMRSRNVGAAVRRGTVDVPAPPARLLADWNREASSLGLAPGDVEALPLVRARARWPDYRRCVQAVSDWAGTLGLPEVLAASEVALMACRGARYHHDAAQYGGAAFCNLFLSEDQGLDVHFPLAGLRIPLVRGTVLLFDTGQPHAVVPRGRSGFEEADFASGRGGIQVFLTWELPIEDAQVARSLGVRFDVDPFTASRLDDAQLRLDGAPATLCPASGRWLSA
jgi:hypothetical protein